MTTTVYKDIRNSWAAKTNHDLPNDRVLIITTMKRHSGQLVTNTHVGKVEGCIFTYMPFSDFNKQLAVSAVRCTKSAVELQHNAALANVETIIAEATAFYNKNEGLST